MVPSQLSSWLLQISVAPGGMLGSESLQSQLPAPGASQVAHARYPSPSASILSPSSTTPSQSSSRPLQLVSACAGGFEGTTSPLQVPQLPALQFCEPPTQTPTP